MLEKDIQKKILAQLRAAGWRAHKVSDRFIAGLPDIHALKAGRPLYLEVKRPGEKPTALQLRTIADITQHGAVASVVCSVDEALRMADVALMCPGSGCGRYADGAGCGSCAAEIPAEALVAQGGHVEEEA